MNILTIAFIAEGNTDHRFLPNLIERLANQILLEQGNGLYEIQIVLVEKDGNGAAEIILNAARKSKYHHLLIIHCDADDSNENAAMQSRFSPGKTSIAGESDDAVCKNVIPIIPIYMTEAWMLADKALLKKMIGTNLNNQNLGLNFSKQQIESIADPKQRIEEVITIHRNSLPRRKRKYAARLSELYEPMSQTISIEELSSLNAFERFRERFIESLRAINYLN